MGTRPTDLNASEWTLLQALWSLGGGTVRDVHAVVAKSTGWARTTVKTLLERMEQKGLLRAGEADGIRRYVPTRRRDEVVPKAVGSFLDRVLGGSLDPLVTYLADARGLSSTEIDQLKALLDRRSRP